MTKISGWIFMAIGAGVSLFSRYVQKRGGEGMAIFFWVGVAMIGIGIFKVAVGFILKDEKKKAEEEEQKKSRNPFQRFGLNKDLEKVDSKKIEIERQQAMNKVQQTSIVNCPTCGTRHYSNSNFCHMCGSRLR